MHAIAIVLFSLFQVSIQAPFLFVSGYSKTINAFNFDLTKGTISNLPSSIGPNAPSFVAYHPTLSILYALNEETSGTISAYSIATDGTLKFLNSVSSAGQGPAHLSVHKSGKYLYSANYGNGNVGFITLNANGYLGTVKTVTGGANAHMAVSDPSGKYLFVPCKGANQIVQFVIQSDGSLVRNNPAVMTTANGAGPRHIDFHPTRNNAYLINELSNTVQTLVLSSSGTLTSIQTLSSLPPNFGGYSSGAEIQVSPNGKFVYVSNRGHNSIGIFSIKSDGTLQSVKWETGNGEINTPRAFSIDPTGKFLLVANQGSNTITGFSINADGTLTKMYTKATISQPSFVQVWQTPVVQVSSQTRVSTSQSRMTTAQKTTSLAVESMGVASAEKTEAELPTDASIAETDQDTKSTAVRWLTLIPSFGLLYLLL
jgi:6-phosphogluconolactonase